MLLGRNMLKIPLIFSMGKAKEQSQHQDPLPSPSVRRKSQVGPFNIPWSWIEVWRISATLFLSERNRDCGACILLCACYFSILEHCVCDNLTNTMTASSHTRHSTRGSPISMPYIFLMLHYVSPFTGEAKMCVSPDCTFGPPIKNGISQHANMRWHKLRKHAGRHSCKTGVEA